VTAQPFRDDPRHRQHENAGGAEKTEPARCLMRGQRRERSEDGEADGHAEQRKRHEPPELRDVDEQGRGDPIEAREEEAEAEAPAEQRRIAAADAAIHEPDETAEGDNEQRRHVDGRERRRGERTEAGGEAVAPPTREAGGPHRGALQRRKRTRGAEGDPGRRVRHWHRPVRAAGRGPARA
jgi:hypothetical protein